MPARGVPRRHRTALILVSVHLGNRLRYAQSESAPLRGPPARVSNLPPRGAGPNDWPHVNFVPFPVTPILELFRPTQEGVDPVMGNGAAIPPPPYPSYSDDVLTARSVLGLVVYISIGGSGW